MSWPLIAFLIVFVLIFVLRMPIPHGLMCACMFYFIVAGEPIKMVGQQTLKTFYANYTIILVVIYCLAFFSLEAFNFYNWVQWLSSIGGSALLTIILILVIENFRSKR